jgi:predicted  nucleic acid-binding Zn-ribbon protein
MNQELEYLVLLQEIDLRIREQELAQEQYPAAVTDLEQGISKAKATLDNAIKKLQKAESEKKAFEDQIENAKTHLEKSQERLNSIKTNREYDAVHAEIEAQKNMLNNAENKSKILNDEIQKMQANKDNCSSEFDRIKSENEPRIVELNAKIGAIDTNIAKISKERDVLIPKISKQYLRTYDLIRKKKKTGKALSTVLTRTCGACYKVLEPQLINEVKRGIKLILCQNCGSILIWSDNTPKEKA